MRPINLRTIILGSGILLNLNLAALPNKIPSAPNKDFPSVPTLLSKHKRLASSDTLELGFYYKILKGWHLYWLNPGDAGQAMQARWLDLPNGTQIKPIRWPIPHKLVSPPLASYGYEDDVLLPFSVSLPKGFSDSKIELRAEVKWLTCNEVCLMRKTIVSLVVDIGKDPKIIDEAVVKKFLDADAAMPILDSTQLKFSSERQGRSVYLRYAGGQPAEFFPYVEGVIADDVAQPHTYNKDKNNSEVVLNLDDGRSTYPDRAQGLLVFKSKDVQTKAYEVEIVL